MPYQHYIPHICQNVKACDPEYAKTCHHAQPHVACLSDYPDGQFMCNAKESSCNPGWTEFSPVLCVPVDIYNTGLTMHIDDTVRTSEDILYDLVSFIEDNDVTDEFSDDGDGYYERWKSGEFQSILDEAKKHLNERRIPEDAESK